MIRTSRRAKVALAILVGGYAAMAIVAGAPNSPLTVLLPSRAHPPGWARSFADALGLADAGRRGLTALAWVLLLVVLAAFAVVVREAWSRRIKLTAVLFAAGCSLVVFVAGPLLLSRDVYTYAAYGRIESSYHHNPYVATLSSFPHDPFVAVASVQWLHGHSHYGPLFTLASAEIVRLSGSAGGKILAFKLLAGVSVALATGLVAFAATRLRPDRAALAAALVGLNPVIVVHTVGGGHVDALLAAPLAAAAALLAGRPRGSSARALAVTVLLTLACLVKTVMLPVLVLWLVWLAYTERIRRARTVFVHLLAVVALTVAADVPFFVASHPLAPLASLGGIESWASPSHLVGNGAQWLVASLASSSAGRDVRTAVEIAFVLFFVVLFLRLVRRTLMRHAPVPLEEFGLALLLVALTLPYLLPWYAVWFVPFLVFFEDAVLMLAGLATCAVLALTLVPADPFHGLTTPAVMDGVHYGAAPALLVVLFVVAARIRGPRGARLVRLESSPAEI